MSSLDRQGVESAVLEFMDSAQSELISLCSRLVQVPAPMPPGDTTAIARFVETYLVQYGVEVESFEPQPGKRSVVAYVGGPSGTPAIVVNAHLDTFEPAAGTWSHGDPYSGAIQGGRIYGAGASDMRAGVATAMMLARALAPHAEEVQRRVVFTFVGDEEAGGKWGTEWLLDNLPAVASARAALIGDQCGPNVIGNAEKGVCFLTLQATGVSAHAAYGDEQSAVHRLLDALSIFRDAATPLELGLDLADRVTVNVGRIHGGVARNLVAASASAEVSIRVPVGASTKALIEELVGAVSDRVQCVSIEVERCSEPSITPDQSAIVESVRRASTAVLGRASEPVTRVGASDARLFREREIDTVVFGPSALNMGAIDECVLIDDLIHVANVHSRVVLDFLLRGSDVGF